MISGTYYSAIEVLSCKHFDFIVNIRLEWKWNGLVSSDENIICSKPVVIWKERACLYRKVSSEFHLN